MFKFEKRISNGWGGRVNYTYSRLKDNQFGESNFFSSERGRSMQDAYNLDDEYSIGLLDVPHKISIAPIVELPFGEGKRWVQSGVGAAILGDWTISSIIGIESGFPIVGPQQHEHHEPVHPDAVRQARALAKLKPTARATSASRRRRRGLHRRSGLRHRDLAERCGVLDDAG